VYIKSEQAFFIMTITGISGGISSTGTWPGGGFNLTLGGAYAGATANVQYSKDSGTTWFSMDHVFKRNRGFNEYGFPACSIRVDVKNATGTPSLTLEMTAI
jgi:hypothetical protein